MRKVLTSRATARVLRSSRALSTSARSRVKIGSDEAYTQIATVRVVVDYLAASGELPNEILVLSLRLQEGTGRKAIVYFTAKWCPPCKMIGPIYDELRCVAACVW